MPVAAVPASDTSVFASVSFDVVSGDSSTVPFVVAVTDVATRSAIRYGGAVGDSVDITIEYASGRLADQLVQQAQLRIYGGGRDTTVTLWPDRDAAGPVPRCRVDRMKLNDAAQDAWARSQ